MDGQVTFLFSLAVFFVVYFGITALIGFIAWRPLAQCFVFTDPIEGDKIPFSQIAVNGVNYKSSVLLRACPMGLYMKAIFLMRFNHPPMLIPWNAIVAIEKKTFVVARYTLVIGAPKIGSITVSDRVYKAIEHYLSVRAS